MAQGKFDEARELVGSLDDYLLEFREYLGDEENKSNYMKESKRVNIFKIRKTARKKDIHLKVKIKGKEGISKEELRGVQKEIAVAINKANRNRNKKISYKIIIQTPLSDGKALPEDYDTQQKKPSYRQKHL